MNFLFTLPSEKSDSIPALRKLADRYCSEFAESVQVDADKVWETAMLGKFEGSLWDSLKGRLFKASFIQLREKELSELRQLLPV